MSNLLNSRLKKVFLVIITFLLVLIIAWFASQPFRLARAERYLRENSFLGAQKALVLQPHSAKAHLQMGEYYQAAENFVAAEKEFQKVIQICQNCQEYKRAYFNLKKIQIETSLRKADVASAESALAEALELYPEDEILHFYYGVILLTQEDYEEGLKHLTMETTLPQVNNQKRIILSAWEKAKVPQEDIYTLMSLGIAFLQTDYSALSPLFWEKVIEKNPQFRDAYVMLGEVYLKTSQNNPQNLTKAQQKLEKAAEIDPVYPKTYQLLAQVYEKIGDGQKAKEAKEKAALLDNPFIPTS